MLYATLKDSIFNYTMETSWHVGEGVDIYKLPHYEVLNIQADGDELEVCEDILSRKVNRRVYTFVGDEAKTILANW